MKINHLSILILAGALALAGCSSKEPVDERPNWQAVPTDYYGGMSIILDQASLPADISSYDLVGAFIGDVCRGVKTPFVEQDGVTRIYLLISPSEAEATVPDQTVVLRYYSDRKQRIYYSEPIPYADEEMLGSMTKGYQPVWKK